MQLPPAGCWTTLQFRWCRRHLLNMLSHGALSPTLEPKALPLLKFCPTGGVAIEAAPTVQAQERKGRTHYEVIERREQHSV